MEIKVRLRETTGIIDTKTFDLVDEQLFYVFDKKFAENTKQIFCINNNKITVKDNRVEIPKDLLKIGKLEATLKIYVDNQLIKSFQIEPLLLTDLHEKIKAIPEIQSLKAEISDLKGIIADLKGEIDKYTQIVEKTREFVLRANKVILKVGK